MITPLPAVVRAWLRSGPVGALCGERISTVYDPRLGVPAVQIGGVSGGPLSSPFTNVDVIETWQVALYVQAGRVAGGDGDLPDDAVCWQVMSAIGEACRDLDWEHYQHTSGARIVAGRIVTATPGVDPDTGSARATVTVALNVWQ